MRISDWSSDVCSSDLLWRTRREGTAGYWLPAKVMLRFCAPSGGFLVSVSKGAEATASSSPRGGSNDHSAIMAPAESVSWARSIGSVCLRSRSEEHTSELQSLTRFTYAVVCLT